MNYNITDSETEEEITQQFERCHYLLKDHLNEHATAEDLINRFTKIQDEHDDDMDDFRQMLPENTAETSPQQQNTNYNFHQVPNTADFANQQHSFDSRDNPQL